MIEDLTWSCHVCRKVRPDDLISVFEKPLFYNGQVCGSQNIRYCNDNPKCINGAKSLSFVNKSWEQKHEPN